MTRIVLRRISLSLRGQKLRTLLTHRAAILNRASRIVPNFVSSRPFFANHLAICCTVKLFAVTTAPRATSLLANDTKSETGILRC